MYIYSDENNGASHTVKSSITKTFFWGNLFFCSLPFLIRDPWCKRQNYLSLSEFQFQSPFCFNFQFMKLFDYLFSKNTLSTSELRVILLIPYLVKALSHVLFLFRHGIECVSYKRLENINFLILVTTYVKFYSIT